MRRINGVYFNTMKAHSPSHLPQQEAACLRTSWPKTPPPYTWHTSTWNKGFNKSARLSVCVHVRPSVRPSVLSVTHAPGEDVSLVSGWFLHVLPVEDELCHLVELLNAASRHFCQAAD